MNSRSLSILRSLVGAAFWAAPAVAQQPGSIPNERKPSPRLELQTVDGRALKIQDMRGRVVPVDFLTIVCPACRTGVGLPPESRCRPRPQGALNVNSPAPLKDDTREHGLTLTFGTATRDAVATCLSHPADRPLHAPTFVLPDREGRICSVEVGWKGEEAWRSQVATMPAE